MQFFYNHPYLTAFLAVMILNIIIKKITKSKASPVGFVLLAIASFIGQACSPFSGAVNKEISNNYYYGKSGKEIRYSPMGNWFELGNQTLDADVKSFMPLSSDFAKDKDHIFFCQYIIDDEVDIHSFRTSDRLGFDKDHVYIPIENMAYSIQSTLKTDKKLFVLEGADPETYKESEDWEWGTDAKNWFYGYKMIDVHYETFTPINEYFCKDNHRVYKRSSFDIIPCEIDPLTFKMLNERYVADAHFIYDYLRTNDGGDPSQLKKFSYESLDNIAFLHKDYLLFDNSVIYEGVLMEDANRTHFMVLESATKAYAKDDQNVYYDGKKIAGVDLATFALYDYDQYARDKNHVYHWGVKMEGVDLETFGAIEKDSWVYKDKNHTYAGAEISEN
ncbi:DKNYY domain-containing protein [Formosa sp. PL04]|nr:DKNYY domain-containing protein [Formosa sp. PL04]